MAEHVAKNINEESIRPKALFDQYLHLAAQDALKLQESSDWVETNCFCCGGHGEFAFEKFGFKYEECKRCQTIFCNPRPSAALLMEFYQNGESPKYWGMEFYRQTAESRREKLWKPKAKKVLDHILNQRVMCQSIVDVGGGYGIFAEEMKRVFDGQVVVVEPSKIMAEECRSRNLIVIEKFFEDLFPEELPSGPRCFTSFELFEHVQNPSSFLEGLSRLMEHGDLLFLTTLSSMGVDIRTLGKNSKAVFPPHHLNFANPKSIEILSKSVGLLLISVETPGQLDLDIMRNNRPFIEDRFWSSFLEYASNEDLARMQQSLAEQGLSSHMQVLFKKARS